MKKAFLWVIAVIAVVSLVSCDGFFSSSWGNPREYKASNIKITTNNLDTIKKTAVGNPEYARAAGEKITNTIKNESNDANKAKYMDAAVELAWIGSELDTFILGQAGGMADLLLDDELEGDDNIANEFVNSLRPLIKSKNFQKTVENLAESAVECLKPGTAGSMPTFIDDYTPTAADVDKAVLTLLAGVLGDDLDNFDDLMSGEGDWDDIKDLTQGLNVSDTDPKKIVVENASKTTDAGLALAAYLNYIADNKTQMEGSLIAGTIFDMISGTE